MNVGELKLLLSQFNDDTPVIVASDAEGNDFHWLDAYGTGFVKTGTTHLYSIYDAEDIKEEIAIAEEWGDEKPEFDPVIVLWP